MQKIRYPNAFYLVYDVEEEIMEERIPPLIIQNFVENSTKYALKADTEIEILVIVRKEEEKLRISVCDNGRGMEKEMLEKINRTGIGPGGLGGTTTALAVNINTYATHIAGLPVAVNICCHVNRHAVREI